MDTYCSVAPICSSCHRLQFQFCKIFVNGLTAETNTCDTHYQTFPAGQPQPLSMCWNASTRRAYGNCPNCCNPTAGCDLMVQASESHYGYAIPQWVLSSVQILLLWYCCCCCCCCLLPITVVPTAFTPTAISSSTSSTGFLLLLRLHRERQQLTAHSATVSMRFEHLFRLGGPSKCKLNNFQPSYEHPKALGEQHGSGQQQCCYWLWGSGIAAMLERRSVTDCNTSAGAGTTMIEKMTSEPHTHCAQHV